MCKKIIQKISLFILMMLLFSFWPGDFINDAEAFARISDTISNSAPGMPSNHDIIFMNKHAIPVGGRIVITPEDGLFFIMGNFNFTDVDLATSSTRDGTYTERNLATSSSATEDSVSAIASSTSGSITINLDSSTQINSDEYVRIKLGTNATYGENGDQQIYNPNFTGQRMITIRSYDNANGMLDEFSIGIFIIQSIKMTATHGKWRLYGQPSGVLGYGTSQTFMSLMTNYQATCRYTTIASSTYDAMPNTFTYTGQYFHSVMLYGLGNGQHYSYFIICRDLFGEDDETEYIISFMVSGLEGNSGDEGGIPGRGGGGSGGGTGGGIGRGTGDGNGPMLPYPPVPGNPSVVLQGWAYPGSTVVLLQDKTESQRATLDAKAGFLFNVYELKQGVYTFGILAEDTDKRKSITQSFTFWIKEGTKTEVYKIVLPPTISASRTTVPIGEAVQVAGQSAPNAKVDVWFYPQTDGALRDSDIIKSQAIADANGKWSQSIDTKNLSKGTYRVKAKTIIDDNTSGEFSQTISIGLGVSPSGGSCPGADLNKDGKVNIFDFSILLYYWGSDNDCADQNQSGKVDLVDFSIMMYYWTG